MSIPSANVAVVGDYGVGKTCLLQRIVSGEYSENHLSTIGVHSQSKVIDVGSRKIKLNFMDTGGDEKFQSMNMIFVRKSVCVLLVYDVTREKSIMHINKWLEEIQQTAPSDVIKILVGNKRDIDTVSIKKSVPTDIGVAVAKYFDIPFFEVSAKKNSNVKKLLNTIAKMSIQLINTRSSQEHSLGFTLEDQPNKPSRGCIC